MTDEQPKRGRGRPKVYGKRQNFNFRVTEETKQRLIDSAMRNGRSLSEEIEFCLGLYQDIEKAKQDIEKAKQDIGELTRQARAWADASRVQAIRAAGLTILREVTGKPTRVVVDFATLVAEADGTMRGLRSGFSSDNAPPPAAPHPMTQEEWDHGTAALAEIRRTIQEAQERAAAEDAAAEEAARQSGKAAKKR